MTEEVYTREEVLKLNIVALTKSFDFTDIQSFPKAMLKGWLEEEWRHTACATGEVVSFRSQPGFACLRCFVLKVPKQEFEGVHLKHRVLRGPSPCCVFCHESLYSPRELINECLKCEKTKRAMKAVGEERHSAFPPKEQKPE